MNAKSTLPDLAPPQLHAISDRTSVRPLMYENADSVIPTAIEQVSK